MICYFDNCICHQNRNCDMVGMMQFWSLVTAIYGQYSTRGVQQELKFTLTKILAIVKTDWSLNHTVVTLSLIWYQRLIA